MASISREPNGRRTIQFMAEDGKRKSIRLGKATQKAADAIKGKVEAIVAASLAKIALDDETAKWLREIPDALAKKLASAGLIASRAFSALALGDFLDSYIAGRTDHKPNTTRNCKMAARTMEQFFGREKNLRDITPGDADEFLVWMKGRGLADATIGRRLKRAKQFFKAATRKKLIRENPFEELRPPTQVNEERKFFVTKEATQRLLDACPDTEWRLIVALSRFGGLRCPSEHLALTWGDVNWERARLKVRSPKTEHLPGGESRVIPLFPELRPHLEEAFDLAEAGTVHVINRYRDPTQNLRTQLLRILKRAGLEVWPKPFHNLRASRETELAADYPIHVVCAWIGNTERIAAKHYLQVTNDDFDRAAEGAAKSGAVDAETALQNAVQQPAAGSRNVTQNAKKAQKTPSLLLVGATGCDYLHDTQVPPRGLEPLS